MKWQDAIIDRSDEQKVKRVEKLRAELKKILRQSVPSDEAPKYWEIGWVYIMPDFDKPNHSIIEWQSENLPVYPPRSQSNSLAGTEHERSTSTGA